MFFKEIIPDEIDASTAHLLKFIPSEQSGPENRIIHERWFLEFTWFVYNHKQERFFCKVCIAYLQGITSRLVSKLAN